MNREIYLSHDKKELSLAVWDNVENAKGVIQISHGMGEHIGRYDEFALFLNKNGYIVIGDDHRAHGLTDKDKLGIAQTDNMFLDTVKDMKGITELIKERYKLPIILLGHSYGSFLTQKYLTLGSENLSAVVLMGSALQKGLLLKIGHSVAKRKVKKGKKDAPADFLIKLTFNAYDKKTKDGISGWLSRDAVEVGKMAVDPITGFDCSYGFYESFFNGLKEVEKEKNPQASKDIKMLIISGGQDKVGNDGKSVEKLYKNYISLGYNPTLKLYDGARHELLKETNRQEVFDYLLEYFNNAI